MKNVLIIVFFIFNLQKATAQDAMSVLTAQYANDSIMLSKIDQFVLGGYERSFHCGSHNKEIFIETLKTYLGTPYKFGGISSQGIDCSGLIYRVISDLGLTAPHGSQELARFGKIVLDKDALQPGDVIFFTKTYNTSKLITHAAFVIEDNQMIHATRSRGVQIVPIDDPYYWNKHYLFGTRIFDSIPNTSVKDTTILVSPIIEIGE